jgi:hypothetical protein
VTPQAIGRPSAPVPLAGPAQARDEAGLFTAGRAADVVRNLRQDLLATGVPIEHVISDSVAGARKYRSEADDRDAFAEFNIGDLRERILEDELGPQDLLPLVQVLYFAGQQRLLAKHHLRFPAYNILDDYFTNAVVPLGPRVLPRPVAPKRAWTVFGRRIGFPIGVPASVLTGGSPWVQYFAGNGFNVLTYKTVRSRAWGPNQPPNWSFVPDRTEPFKISSETYGVLAEPWDWVNPGKREVTTANSFGVPSPDPYEWMADVSNALTVLADDQMLIVSVMGDHYDNGMARLESIVSDFVDTARMAQSAGAEVVELNLSCPNSLDESPQGVKPPLCFDSEVTAAIVEGVREALDGKTAIVAKLSYLDEESLAGLVHKIAPLVDGISGINTLQCKVLRPAGGPTFPGRQLAGVSGVAVRDYALDFVGRLARLRVETGHYFEILGMGGVTDIESFGELFAMGANVVQSASGSFANPFLAVECVEALGSDLPEVAKLYDGALVESLKSEVVRSISQTGQLSKYQIAAALPLRPVQVYELLDELTGSGDIAPLANHPGTYTLPGRSSPSRASIR